MAKYRKKPVVIEAFQYDGDLSGKDGYYVPKWAVKAFEDGVIKFKDAGDMYIETLEGDMQAHVGDWVIKGVKGELFPCKPDVFEMTFELIEDETCEGYEDCEGSLYTQMTVSLAEFVIHAAGKENATDAELKAMSEMAKMLFRTR